MNNDEKPADLDTKDVPQEEVFSRKEIYQHPQPADRGKPLDPPHPEPAPPSGANIKEAEKTRKEQGLNEEKVGPSEGLQNQGD